MRVDKLTLSALESTLRVYLDPDRALSEIPVLAMLTAPVEVITSRAHSLSAFLREAGIESVVIPTRSSPGGGAFPTSEIASCAIALGGGSDAALIEERLRLAATPVIGRMSDGQLFLDLRSVLPRDDAALARAVAEALR